MPTLEETVKREQEEHDAAEQDRRDATGPEHDEPAATEPEPDPGEPAGEEPNGQTTIIDRSQYEREDLAIARVDGNQIDRIRIAFSGSIMLDRSEPADVALYNRLTLGKGEVTLMVEGVCSSTAAKQATNRDGELDVIVGEKTVKVRTVYVPAVEELETELARSAGGE